MAVNRARAAGLLEQIVVVGGGQEAVDVDGRKALHGQHHGMGAQKALDVKFISLTGHGALQGIKERDVDFVGLVSAVHTFAHRNLATELAHGFHQLVALLIAKQAFCGT